MYAHCPNCANAVEMDALECRKCGASFAIKKADARYPVEFTASAGEYFRIWIVNLALTIVTLGIYSAWAKVRKRRYFYAHTRIDGEGFEYRGKPAAILKGRLLAVAVLGVFYGASAIAPWLIAVGVIAGVFVLPWLVVRSLAFNARNTAYRNVVFHFRGSYAGCLKLVLGYALMVLVTLGIALLAYPYFKRWLAHFAAENHSYGTTPFTVSDFKKPFIQAYSHGIGLSILAGIPVGGIGAMAGASTSSLVVALSTVPGYIIYFAFMGYLRARTLNAVWNSIAIGGVRFESRLRARDMMGIYITNVAAVFLTLGLATPWAVVRTMRYRAGKTAVLADGPLDGFAQAQAQEVSAAGQEVAEMLDIDIAL